MDFFSVRVGLVSFVVSGSTIRQPAGISSCLTSTLFLTDSSQAVDAFVAKRWDNGLWRTRGRFRESRRLLCTAFAVFVFGYGGKGCKATSGRAVRTSSDLSMRSIKFNCNDDRHISKMVLTNLPRLICRLSNFQTFAIRCRWNP